MQEVFYEETSICQDRKKEGRKYNACVIGAVVAFALLTLFLIYMFTFYNLRAIGEGAVVFNILLIVLPPVIFLIWGIYLIRLRNKFCLDYDYTFVSGEIKFSKVVKSTNRIHICKFECIDIEKIGITGSKDYESYIKRSDIDVMYLTSNNIAAEGKKFYYLYVYNAKLGRNLYVLECTDEFIRQIVPYIKPTILEKGLR